MVYLGFSQRSGEYVIGGEEGIDRARTIRRHTPDKQWDPDFINKIKGSIGLKEWSRYTHQNGS